jgi:hypothetical protein
MATYFDKLVEKIFPAKLKGDPTTIVHEIIRRSDREKQEYQKWKEREDSNQWLKEIEQAYHYKKTQIRSTIDVHLFSSNGANGFAVTYHPSMNKKDFQHLFDFFKEQTLGMGYRVASSDRRIADRGNFIETKDKYYLKPPLNAADLDSVPILCDQLYGNVLIEQILVNDKPSYIKLLVSFYSDRMYKEARSYDEFIERLFHKVNE